MEYKAANGSRLSNDQAQRYGECLEGLIDKDQVTPASIVDRARNSDNALHEFFEWDDRRAAAGFRLSQAAYLLRSIHVVIKTGDEREITTRAFVNVHVTEELPKIKDRLHGQGPKPRSVFVTVQKAITDEGMRAEIIAEALRQLMSWRTRYKEYQELSDVFQVIDVVQERLLLPEAVAA